MAGQSLPLRFAWFDPRLLPAAISGLLLAGAFPPFSQGLLGFVALVPLLLTMDRRPFASGFTCGIFFFAPLLYWLNIVMTRYGGLAPFFSLVAWLFLCAYLALYVGAALWLTDYFRQRLGILPVFSLPFIWIALEYLRGHLLTGFPWGLLGYAAIEMPWLRQVADLFGVFGLSFLFVMVNAAFVLVLQRRFQMPAVIGGLLCLVLLGGGLGYGWYKLPLPEANLKHLQVGLVQGNVEQQHKWDRNYRQQTLDQYRELSLEATKKGAELVIWPEAATPFYIQEKNSDSRQVLQIAKTAQRYLLFGGPSYQPRPDGSYRYFNSAFLLDSRGTFRGRSDKIHLVPFGEYVPFGNLLFFINKLVAGVGDYSPGTVTPLTLNGHDLGVLICYEAIFPELARDYVRKGSDLLVNLTNDAWFGRSSAPRQLLDMTRMRAIENRIWIARAANTGISALIDPAGQTHGETPIFETVSMTGQVELGARPSLYRRIGDLLPLISLFLLGAGLVWIVFHRRQP